jgi:Na+/H+ antiporter NhaC
MDTTQSNQQASVAPVSTETNVDTEKNEVNIYPTIRHLVLIICALLTIAIILFLFYQNGKSIYDNGL